MKDGSASPGYTGIVIGLITVAVGALSWSGRGLRLPSSSIRGRPAIPLAVGLSFLFAGLQWILRRSDLSALATLVAVLAAVTTIAALWFYFVGAPGWATPSWQKEISE